MSFTDLDLRNKWELIQRYKRLNGKRITVVDPDDERNRNVYEDLDQESSNKEFMVVLTMYPEFSKAQANGEDDAGVVTMSHEEAVRDIQIMLKQGYVIRSIERDRVQI